MPVIRPARPRRRLLLAVAVALVLLVLAALVVGLRPALLAWVALAAVTVPLCVIDQREHRLPDALVLPTLVIGLVAAAAEGVHGFLAAPSGSSAGEALAAGATVLGAAVVGGAGAAGFLGVLHLAGGMGMGDVKLGAVLGVALSLVGGAWAVVGAVVVAFLLGGVVGLVRLLRGDPSPIPFGPYLLAAAWLALLASPS